MQHFPDCYYRVNSDLLPGRLPPHHSPVRHLAALLVVVLLEVVLVAEEEGRGNVS